MKNRYFVIAKIIILISINIRVYAGNEHNQLFFMSSNNSAIIEEPFDKKHFIGNVKNPGLKNCKNDDSQIDSIVNYTYTSKTVSQHSVKMLHSYNAHGNLSSILIMHKNHDNNKWAFYKKIEYGYDIIGNTVLYKLNSWDDQNNSWHTNLNIEYSYNSDGLLISETISFYPFSNTGNPHIYINEYEYNDLGKPTSIIGYNLENENWVYEDKEKYEYGSCDSLVVNVFYYTWNSENGEWLKYGCSKRI